MKRGMIAIAVLTSLWVTLPRPSAAQDAETNEETHPPTSSDPHAKPRRVTVGFNFDLFPIIASAAQGQFGFAGQLQLAIDRVQFRLVGAKLRNFSFFLEDDFEDYDTVVLAFLLDFFFRDDLSGFWVSSGFELWLNEIGNSNTTSRADWTDTTLPDG